MIELIATNADHVELVVDGNVVAQCDMGPTIFDFDAWYVHGRDGQLRGYTWETLGRWDCETVLGESDVAPSMVAAVTSLIAPRRDEEGPGWLKIDPESWRGGGIMGRRR